MMTCMRRIALLVLLTGIITSVPAAEADGGFGSGLGTENSYAPSYPDRIPRIGALALFAGTTPNRGRELWVTDGTRTGTRLLRDIASGSTGSHPWQLTRVGSNRVFFSADDGIHGRELWVSDGTTAGTVLVKNIAAGSASSYPGHLTAVGARLFFTAFEPDVGYALWVSDGTTAGTVKIKDLDPSTTTNEFWYNWHHTFCAVGDILYFNGSDPVHGNTLWKSDGSTAGTVRVIDVSAGQPGATPITMAAFQGKLFYVSRDDAGSRIWSSDGTEAGTMRFSNDLTGPDFLTAIGDSLWIRGTMGGSVNGIWVTQGDDADLIQVSTTLSAPGWFVGAGNLVFMAPDAPGGFEYRPLSVSNGTTEGTDVVADLSVGNIGLYANIPLAVGNRVFFSSVTGSADGRLHVSDGTGLGTFKVTDQIASAATVGAVGTRALVTHQDDINAYSMLWSTDGTDAGTFQIFPVAPTVVGVTLVPDFGSLIAQSPTSVLVTFSRAMDAATVSTSSIALVGSGGDGAFIDGNEVTVVPAGVTLTTPTTVTIDLTGVTLADDRYRIFLSASGAMVLRDLGGSALDGDLVGHDLTSLPSGDDFVGGEFVAEFVLDTQAPTLVFTTPVVGGATYTTSAATVLVAGASVDSVGVDRVTWALTGATVASGTATGTWNWSFPCAVNVGSTTVLVTTEDAAGNTNTGSIVIVRDPTAVAVAVTAPTTTGVHATNASSMTIAGTASSVEGIAQVTYELNGATTTSGTASGTTSWTFDTPDLSAGQTTITITAHDALGGTGTVAFILSRDLNAPTLTTTTVVLRGTAPLGVNSIRIEGGATGTISGTVDTVAQTWNATIPAPQIQTVLTIVLSDGTSESSCVVTIHPLVETAVGGG